MKVSVKWEQGASFLGETPGGHSVRMDGPPDAGGLNLGPRPMETVLMGTGACSSFHVVHILGKARQRVTACVVDVTAERAATDPQVFTRIGFHYTVTGQQLKPELVQRAIDLSAEKYCSASIMLGKTAVVTHEFEIREVPANQDALAD
ncbi:MAG: OsmC family protein [Rubrivivax sp.]|nr:MAG: OsmC family protein [Rubrivivax sp.]